MTAPLREPIRTVIVDDEKPARAILRRLLQADSDVELVGETSGCAAPDLILHARPDLVFLDVQMPGMSGLDVVAAVRDRHVPLFVFVTAYDRHAVRAFELRALDFLLKPFTDERFQEALLRAKASVRRGEAAALLRRVETLLERQGTGDEVGATTPVFRDRLTVKRDGRVFLLHSRDVDWFEAAGSLVRAHGPQGAFVLGTSLRELEDSLDPRAFFRVHRSAIVNLDRVREFQHWSHGDYVVLLHDGTELRLSRTRRAALERRIGSAL